VVHPRHESGRTRDPRGRPVPHPRLDAPRTDADEILRADDPRTDTGPRAWQRWVPGLGSFRDTFGAHRTRLLVPGPLTFAQALHEYHRLCPDGSLRVAAALRRWHLAQTHSRVLGALSAGADLGLQRQHEDEPAPGIPADLVRRMPVNPRAYQGWREVWAELRAADADHDTDTGPASRKPGTKTTAAIASKHGLSPRHVQFVRSAGELGLLDSPIPLLVRMARFAETEASENGNSTDTPASGVATV
jgi:hypothetical protein